jgi:hypothetical protein
VSWKVEEGNPTAADVGDGAGRERITDVDASPSRRSLAISDQVGGRENLLKIRDSPAPLTHHSSLLR